MISYNEYKKQTLIENPGMTENSIKRSYDLECELEKFDNVPKSKFKPWGKKKLMILISNS
jgi:hypothetical protein